MKIAIIGGGPAGLYAAILLKKQRPRAEITVYERNGPTTRLGSAWCSPTPHWTISRNTIRRAIAASPRNSPIGMTIAVHFRGTVHRVGGNGLLRLLAAHAAVESCRSAPANSG